MPQATPELRREYQAKWRAANAEKVRAGKAQWSDENRDHVRDLKRVWREANRDKVRNQWSNCYERNLTVRLRGLFGGVKYRAKRDGLLFDLIFDEIAWPEFCPVLGIKINYDVKGIRNRGDGSPSFDRTVPELGYTKGNVVIMSWRANRIKYDTTIDELDKLLTYMKKVRSH